MNTNKRITLAIIFLSLYGAFVLINALTYYFILLPGETNLFRAVLRVFGVGLLSYFLFKRSKAVYWITLVASCILAILGILGVILISGSVGFNLEGLFNLIPALLLLVTSSLLLSKEVRKEFK